MAIIESPVSFSVESVTGDRSTYLLDRRGVVIGAERPAPPARQWSLTLGDGTKISGTAPTAAAAESAMRFTLHLLAGA